MVGSVVGGGDGVEHLLDVRCGGVLVGGAYWASSGGEFVLGGVFGSHKIILDARDRNVLEPHCDYKE